MYPNRDLKLEYSRRVAELKRKLRETDYKAIKYAEGEITAEEYAETKELRKGWREEINALETKIKSLRESMKEDKVGGV